MNASSKPFPIPVREAMPGLAPEETRHADDAPQYPEMPRGMMTFSMPLVPETADATAVQAARRILQTFLDALNGWTFSDDDGQGPRCDLGAVPESVLAVIDDMLGEGEVSVRIDPDNPLNRRRRDVRVQETVFTGVWRVLEFDADGAQTKYWIEAGSLPTVVHECALHDARSDLPRPAGGMPAGAMNVPALFTEMEAHLETFAPRQPARVINLTLLPLTPVDHQVLQEALPVGPVAIISRSFGSCRVTSTGVRNVWRVQHFNSKNTLILNTLEIVGLPQSILAAGEDIEDTRGRLAELIDWMAESLESSS